MANRQYVLVTPPANYPGKTYHGGKYAYQHIVVYWQNTGVIPSKTEIIHHINEDKLDNRYENLLLISRSEHTRHHSRQTEYTSIICSFCGALKRIEKRKFVKRTKQNFLTGNLYCSINCAKKNQRNVMAESGKVKWEHGTYGMYRSGKCRCQPCKTANTARVLALRKKKALSSGVV